MPVTCQNEAGTTDIERHPDDDRTGRDQDVIDDEFSRAVVACIRGAGLAWPHRCLDAVAEAVGADVAERLAPHLERLSDETVYGPVDWSRHDLGSAQEVVRSALAERHPELSGAAAEALI